MQSISFKVHVSDRVGAFTMLKSHNEKLLYLCIMCLEYFGLTETFCNLAGITWNSWYSSVRIVR